MMRFTKPLAALAGLTMAASPVLAQSAAPLSLASASAPMEEGNGLTGDNYILPAILIFGILAAAILISNEDGGLTNPASP
jgi:hypothetical protein